MREGTTGVPTVALLLVGAALLGLLSLARCQRGAPLGGPVSEVFAPLPDAVDLGPEGCQVYVGEGEEAAPCPGVVGLHRDRGDAPACFYPDGRVEVCALP